MGGSQYGHNQLRVLLILYVMPAHGSVNMNGVKIFLW
uniref:Uncharacterized protein n=1 Tax=Arundo donax TaxID=35708 RepID=A0A0A9CTF3_ARUDO